MPIARRLKAYLDDNHVAYAAVRHPLAITAHQLAASLHVPQRELAKTVIVEVEGRKVMVVLPATHRVDFERLRAVLGERDVRLVPEAELRDLFPQCELGAMPPFGNLYGLPVYCDAELAEDEEIVFNAGSHEEAIRLLFRDFARLVDPRIADIGRHP